MLFIGVSGGYRNIRVGRTDNLSLLCRVRDTDSNLPLLAEITALRQIRIFLEGGGNLDPLCDLPRGYLVVVPQPVVFDDVAVGGLPQFAVRRRTVELRNDGDDCMVIEDIGDRQPFSISRMAGGTSIFPMPIEAGDNRTITVEFRTSSFGDYEEDLPVRKNPSAVGDSIVTCTGRAREARAALRAVSNPVPLGVVAAGGVGPGSAALVSESERTITVSIPARVDAEIIWGEVGPNLALDPGPLQVPIMFRPLEEREYVAEMSVASDAGNLTIQIRGYGCVPNGVADPDPERPLVFGRVEAGYQTVRFIRVRNTGDGSASFRARIVGTDSVLFRLFRKAGRDIRSWVYDIPPIMACGDVPTGDGEVLVSVEFEAAGAPRAVSAELVIDGATGATPRTWVYALTAEVTVPKPLDVAVSVDRSGSMGEMLGDRNKAEAARAATRLFVQLLRVDAEDRFAVVRFNQRAEVLHAISPVSSENKALAFDQITPINLAPTGATSIAAGVDIGLEEIASLPRNPPDLGKCLLVLTDGMDNTAYEKNGIWYSILGGPASDPNSFLFNQVNTRPLSISGDVRVYSIGLGRDENVDIAVLDYLAAVTGGHHRVTRDLEGAEYFELEKYFVAAYMDMVSMSGVLDPAFTIRANEKHRIEFDVGLGDVGFLVTVFDGEGRLPFYLLSPLGEVIDPSSVPAAFSLRAGASPTARFLDVATPRGETERYVGTWKVIVEHEGVLFFGTPDATDRPLTGFITEEFKEWDAPTLYGVSIGVKSNLRLTARLSPGFILTGQPIAMTAVLEDASVRLADCQVSVRVVSPSGQEQVLRLVPAPPDQGDDAVGNYTNVFTSTAEGGSYEFTFSAEGRGPVGNRFRREQTLSKYVVGRLSIPGARGDAGPTPSGCCKEMEAALSTLNDVVSQLVEKKSKRDKRGK